MTSPILSLGLIAKPGLPAFIMRQNAEQICYISLGALKSQILYH